MRVNETVSHGLGSAYDESKRRGRGSGSAGGHTGNGQGPRVLSAGLRGAGRSLGTAPGVPSAGRTAGQSVRPGTRGFKVLVSLSEAQDFTGQARQQIAKSQPVTAAFRWEEGGRSKPRCQDLRWRLTLRKGRDGDHVGMRKPCHAAAAVRGRDREGLQGLRDSCSCSGEILAAVRALGRTSASPALQCVSLPGDRVRVRTSRSCAENPFVTPPGYTSASQPLGE